jgi:hypothetical protein
MPPSNPITYHQYFVRLHPRPPKRGAPRVRQVTATSDVHACVVAERLARAYEAVEVSRDALHWWTPTRTETPDVSLR